MIKSHLCICKFASLFQRSLLVPTSQGLKLFRKKLNKKSQNAKRGGLEGARPLKLIYFFIVMDNILSEMTEIKESMLANIKNANLLPVYELPRNVRATLAYYLGKNGDIIHDKIRYDSGVYNLAENRGGVSHQAIEAGFNTILSELKPFLAEVKSKQTALIALFPPVREAFEAPKKISANDPDVLENRCFLSFYYVCKKILPEDAFKYLLSEVLIYWYMGTMYDSYFKHHTNECIGICSKLTVLFIDFSKNEKISLASFGDTLDKSLAIFATYVVKNKVKDKKTADEIMKYSKKYGASKIFFKKMDKFHKQFMAIKKTNQLIPQICSRKVWDIFRSACRDFCPFPPLEE
jgi:hypothetical protein